MLFHTPELDELELRAIDRIEELHRNLRFTVTQPKRWLGTLRQTALARAIQGSNSIEGYNVTLDDAVAAVEGEPPREAGEESWAAVQGYRTAMTYVLQLADEERFVLNEQLINSLHFMMASHDLYKSPGRWRPGAIFVHNDATGEILYEGPDGDAVPELMAEFVDRVADDSDRLPPMVAAGMAHLNLVMVHPFRDGNGRMSRCIQTLVLARKGIVAQQLCSIEEYLGQNTQAYYDVLGQVGGGNWHPERDARPWLRFVLNAHFAQAQTHLRRVDEIEALWGLLEAEVAKRHLPQRVVSGLYSAAVGRRLTRSRYLAVTEGEPSELVASRDLRAMVSAGLIEAHGEKRGRFYVATQGLKALRDSVRQPRSRAEDLFAQEQLGLLTND